MAFNGIKYIKNVTKSFGYAMVEVAGDMSPAIKAFTESNEELGKELYASVKDWKGTIKKAKTPIVESDVYEFAKAYKENLFDDLKNGTFYNKARIEDYNEKIAGYDDESLKAEFEDMFDDDGLGDWDEGDLRSDLFLADEMDEVGMKIAESNAEVTARSAEYIVKGQKESTKILYEQNNKLMGQALKGMAAINANIGQLSSLPNMIEINTNNASKFFETTTGQLNRVVELLEHISANTDTTIEQQQNNEDAALTFSDIVDSKGMPNMKKYFKNVKGNIKKVIDENGGGMLGNMFGGGNVLMAFAASPLEELTKQAVKSLVPKIVENSMSQFNDTLQGFFGSMISKINKGADSDNPLMNWVQKILGIDSELRTNIDPSQYNKGKVAWDGASRKALVEIIPAQLSKIVSALTGEAPKVFDPNSGTMVSVASINQNSGQKVQRAANYAGYDLRNEIEKVLEDSKMSFNSYREKENFNKDLDAFMLWAFENGGIDANNLRSRGLLGKTDLTGMGVGNAKRLERVFNILKKRKSGRKALMNYNRRILNERDSLSRRTIYDQENGSVESFLVNGMFDEFLDAENTEDNIKLRKAGFNTVGNLAGVQTFAKQIDNYGNNVFYYLQEILKREDKMYEYQGIMLENWGAGGGGKGRGKGKGKGKGTSIKVNKNFIGIRNNEDEVKNTADFLLDRYEYEQDSLYKSERDRFRSNNANYVDGSDLDKFEFNADTAELARQFDEDKAPKNFIDKMLGEKSLEGKFGVIQAKVQSFVNKPLIAFGKMLGSADDKMFDLIYGDGDKELEEKGLLGVMQDSIQNTFIKVNGWIDEKILTPIKAKLDLKEPGDLGRKIFGLFGWNYDEYKEKMKQGVFGVKDKDTGRRSGGLLGDYVQDVKDNAKGAWNWMKDGVSDVFGGIGGGSAKNILSKYTATKQDLGHYFKGGMVDKTGIAAVSEGEIIIPSELNPYYHGKTDKKQQIKAENNAVKKFFGGFAPGGVPSTHDSSDDKIAIDLAIEDNELRIKEAGIDNDSVRTYLSKIKPNPNMDANKKIDYYIRNTKKYISRVTKIRKKLKGKDVEINDYNNDEGYYRLTDGTYRKMNKGEYAKKDRNGKINLMKASAESYGSDVVDELFGAGKVLYNSLIKDNRKGSSDPTGQAFNAAMDDVKDNFKSYAGAMTVGGGVGAAASLITGMFGGPLLGAAVGSAVGLTMKSDKVQEWLFGKEVTDENGNQKHVEGALSEKTSKFLKEQLPDLAKFGLVGGAAGTIMGHPLLGTLIGAGVGYARKSEKFANLMFNGEDENGHANKGLLNMTQEEFEKKMQKRLPKMGAGAIVGAMVGPLPGGILANMMLGSAIGFVSDTDKFKDFMFGKPDKDGNRQGGLLKYIAGTIVNPFRDFAKDLGKDIKKWFSEKVADPIVKAIEPTLQYLTSIPKRIGRFFKRTGKVSKSPFFRKLGRKIIEPARKIGGKVVKGAVGLAKLPFTGLGKAAQFVGSAATASNISTGYADNMTNEEILEEFNNNWFLRNSLNDVTTMHHGRTKKMYDMYTALSGMNQDTMMGLRDAIVGIDDVDTSYKNKRNQIIRDMNNGLLDNYSIRQRDKEKLLKLVEKGNFNPEDARKYAMNLRSATGKGFNQKDIDSIIGVLTEGSDKLSALDRHYSDGDFELSNKKNFDNFVKNLGFNPKNDSEKAMLDMLMDKKYRSIVLDNLNSSISKYDLQEQAAQQQQEEDDNSPATAGDNTSIMEDFDTKQNERHKEMVDVLKQAVNYLAKITGADTPFDEAGNYHAQAKDNGKAGPTDFRNEAPSSISHILPNHGDNNYSEAEVSEQEIADPVTAAFGGKIRKSGYAALSKGELIIPKKFANKFYGSYAFGGRIGKDEPQKFINTPDGRYIFDAESNEYEAADQETRNADAKKKKQQDAIISIPDKIDKMIDSLGGDSGGEDGDGDESKDKGIISTLLDQFGVNGDIKMLLSGLTSPRTFTTLAGPILLAAFVSGKLDSSISSISQFIAGLFGGEDAAMNVGLSGENGEESYSGNALENIARNTISGTGSNMVSDVFNFFGKRASKNATKYAGKKGIKNTISRFASEKVSSLWNFLGNTAKKGEDAISSGRDSLNSKIMDAFKGQTDDIVEDGVDKASKSGIWDTIKNLGKSNSDDAAKAAADLAEEVVDVNSEGSKNALNIVKEKITDFLSSVRKKTGKLPVDDKVIANCADDIADEAASLAKTGAKNTGKKTFIGNLKSLGPIGWAATVIFAITDFTDGYTRASTILGVEYPTAGQCAVSGLISAIKGVIEGIIACIPVAGTAISIALSLIPMKTFVTIFCETIGKALSPELIEQRQEFVEVINNYNKENGTSYDTEQYNATVRNQKGLWSTVVSEVKKLYSSEERQKSDSGLDKNGKEIAGYIDTNTARWQYWQAQINKGLDSDYAEAMYLNECLHDSQLTLTDERIADYKNRIAAYKATAGAKEIPEITNDLHGLIVTGKISSFKGKNGANIEKFLFGASLAIAGKATGADDVDYGGGNSSGDYTINNGADNKLDDYSGSYATGGIIGKSGYASLSKGELVVNNAKDAIGAILGKIFNTSGKVDTEAYEESTDLDSFIEKLTTFDPEKNSWKDFWKSIDAEDEKDYTAATPIKKLIKRVVATMFAPTFAMSKAMSTVSGVLGIGIGASSSSSSESYNSAIRISSNSNKNGGWLSTVTSTAKSAFGKAKDVVSVFLSNIGNGIKSLFGGASGMPISGSENYDSADGSFISQMSSKYKNFMYGDSTFSEEGCAPATAAMFLNNAGVTQSAEQAAKFALSKGYKVKGDGTKDQYFKDYFNSNGIGTASANNSSDIYKSLSSGKPVVLLGQDSNNTSKKKSPFGKDPHYVLATGLDSNGNVIVNDPEATRGGIRYKRNILDKVKSGITTKIAGGRSGIARYGGGDVASQVWYFLRQNGFTEQAAAGVMGNLKQETNMNPACEVKNVTCGIACWDFQNGKSALKEAAKKAGVEWTDLGFQLDYLLKGLPNAFKNYTGKQPHYYDTGEWCWWPTKMTFDEFKALTSINDAAEIFERVYERASKPNIANRQKYANEYYKQFTGKEGEPVSYTGGDYSSSTSDSTSDSSSLSTDSLGDAIKNNFNKVLKSIYGFSLGGDESSSDSTETGDGSDSTSYSTSTATVTTADGATVSQSTTIGADVAEDAANYVGNKYVWGGNDLNNGIDCSGFVQQLYKKHGFSIPMRRAVDMFNDSKTGTTIKGGTYKDLKPGDAMYFSNNGQSSGVHHTGIYVGNGHMIHAQGKDTGVVNTDLSKSSYYQRQYIGAKRFGSGSGLVDPNKVITAQRLFGGSSWTDNVINSNNAVQMRRFSEQQGKISADIENASIRNMSSADKTAVKSESFNELMTVLKQIADNTSSIAMICDLIKKIAGINKEDSKNTTTQTTKVSGKKNQDYTANENDIIDIVSTLMSLAQA